MSDPFILTAQSDGIATITLNRPDKRNAMHDQLIIQLLQAIKAFGEDDSVKVLLLHGNGDNFCAGGDIQWMQTVANGSYEDNVADAKLLADMIYALYSLKKPTIALAHGATLGGGLGLLSACDMVVASQSAEFGFSEVKIGITPSIVSPYVIAAIGVRAAQFYFLTGKRFDAEEAYRIGLVHQLCSDKELLKTGASLAKDLLKNGPNALSVAKQLIRHVAKEAITPELVQMTADHLASLRVTPEAQEGLNAFIKKRPPEWK